MSLIPYNIILNIDNFNNGHNSIPLYKIYGSYYRSKILETRENIDIHPNVLYVINCYNIEGILSLKTYDDFIKSNLSNPIQEMLMIRYNQKITVDFMKSFFNTVIDPIKKQFPDNCIAQKCLLYESISTKYNVIVLTSDVNLGIARSRDRAINYIVSNRQEFSSYGLKHVLLLDDSDFIGFTNIQKININYLYRQQSTSPKGIMKRSSTAAGFSYWQHLIPIDKIELYCPLIADLAEDAVTEAHLNDSYELQTYYDNFVDYKSYLYGTEPKETKMSKHYNPPSLYIYDDKLCVYTTSGNIIPLNLRMKMLLFTKYVFLLSFENNELCIIARGSKSKNKLMNNIQNNLNRLYFNPNIKLSYCIIQQTSNNLASPKDIEKVENMLKQHSNNILYIPESLFCDSQNNDSIIFYKLVNINHINDKYNTLIKFDTFYYCYKGDNLSETKFSYYVPIVQTQILPLKQQISAGGNDTIDKNILKIIYMLIILITVVVVITFIRKLNKNEIFKKQTNNVA